MIPENCGLGTLVTNEVEVICQVSQTNTQCRPQFTIRSAIGVILLAALAFGWYSSLQRESETITRLSALLAYAETELAKMDAGNQALNAALRESMGSVLEG